MAAAPKTRKASGRSSPLNVAQLIDEEDWVLG
jgi:hypothetical protein